ncbi:type I-C CRISPR-associated endonuclease Cas1c [Hydrogenimonas sp.]
MNTLLNTLYVTTEGSYVHLDNETVRIEKDHRTLGRVPLHHLGSIVLFGNVLISPQLLAKCAKEGRSVAYFDANGRFCCRMEGPVSGNILLRQAQCDAARNPTVSARLARNIVAGKLRNTRTLQRRAARELENDEKERLSDAADHISALLRRLERAEEVDEIRGIEGEGARTHFKVLPLMLKPFVREDFAFSGRNRRPPTDRFNALLSFLYTLLIHDAVSALEGVGLDPREGFLHALRPGRPALGLDLVEEFRVMFADRLALALVNRRQVSPKDFRQYPGGGVLLEEKGRKTVLAAYQNKKNEMLTHPLLKQKVPLGLLIHIQARLLARTLRKDMDEYLPMIFR